MATPFKLKIITPDKSFFDGETEQIIVRTTQGDIGVLAKHVSYVASLPSGPLRVKQPNGEYRVAAVSNGVLKVSPEKTTIIATAVEWADEIDVERAKRSEQNARERLKAYNSGKEFERADLKLKRALNRLSVSEKH